MEILAQALIYIIAAVIAVPIANRLGLGSVLGYLIAGMVIGPMLGIVGSETTELQHFAEFGVVMMLFLVGLELEPARLWAMRNKLIGLGGLQVAITGLVGCGVGMYFGIPWQSAFALGFILALSSTAIVVQTLNERGLMNTEGGQSAFSVLLFQDIAVIPMIAFLPFFAIYDVHHGADGHSTASNLLEGLPVALQVVIIFAVIIGIIIGGVYLTRPLFRYVASARLREIYTATALLIVVGIAVLMQSIGLSPALGAFIAGVVLSGSEYRHELESDLAPFGGLLLGLFFITVGALIDFELFMEMPFEVLGYALLLMLLKFVVLFLLGTIFKLKMRDRWLFALSLAQAGEFAFVLLNMASNAGVILGDQADRIILVVAISMVLTPLLFIIYERIIIPRFSKQDPPREHDEIDSSGLVILAGMGRFGQVVGRFLMQSGYECVLLDFDIDQIERFRRIGVRAYFGDATHPDLLHAAGIEDAKMVIASLDEKEKQVSLVEYISKNYPHVTVAARAYDRGHAYELLDAGADIVERENFEGSIMLGRKCLADLGEHPYRALQLANKFRELDIERMDKMHEVWEDDGNSDNTLAFARKILAEQEALMQQDRQAGNLGGLGWNPPPRDEKS